MKKIFVLIMGITTGMIAHSATTITSATYEVPAAADLQMVNKFKISSLTVKGKGPKTQIQFAVPEDLTGAKNILTFVGEFKSGLGDLHSENGDLNCSDSGSSLTCKVDYMNLKFNQDRIEQILSSKHSGDLLQKSRELQRQFSTDPIGIVHIYYRK